MNRAVLHAARTRSASDSLNSHTTTSGLTSATIEPRFAPASVDVTSHPVSAAAQAATRVGSSLINITRDEFGRRGIARLPVEIFHQGVICGQHLVNMLIP